MSTRSKQKQNTLGPSFTNLSKRQTKDNVNNGLFERVCKILGGKEDSKSLLNDSFNTLNDTIWWRILPLDDGYDDNSIGMGIEWEELLPLLTDSGLLFCKEGSKKYQLRLKKWESLMTELPGKFEMGTYNASYIGADGRRKRCKQYFI